MKWYFHWWRKIEAFKEIRCYDNIWWPHTSLVFFFQIKSVISVPPCDQRYIFFVANSIFMFLWYVERFFVFPKMFLRLAVYFHFNTLVAKITDLQLEFTMSGNKRISNVSNQRMVPLERSWNDKIYNWCFIPFTYKICVVCLYIFL